MTDALQQRISDRYQILNKLYELTDGRASRHSINIRDVAREVNMPEDRAFSAFEYLVAENLAEWMALGGFGTISHWGIKEVEQAHNGIATSHFPSNIVLVTSSQNVQVVQGQGNTTTMNLGTDSTKAVEALQKLLSTVESPIPREGVELVEYSREPERHRFEIAKTASSLAERDHKWVMPLVEFAKSTLSELGAKVLAEAILFGLRGA